MSRFVAALAASLVAGAATAQEFKGAEVSAEILAYTEDTDIGDVNYRGSVEMGLFAGFGVQADLGFNDSRTLDLGSRTMTVHAVYDALDVASVGLFFSRDRIDVGGVEGDADVVGIEAGSSFGSFGAEGYLSRVEADGLDATFMGVEGSYDIGASISVIGAAGQLSDDDISIGRASIGGEYRFGTGPSVYAEVGRLGVDDGATSDSETFVTLGARVALGPNDGTTFGSRGIFDVISGF